VTHLDGQIWTACNDLNRLVARLGCMRIQVRRYQFFVGREEPVLRKYLLQLQDGWTAQ
jgi:hypothetical protein